jgi:ATP-dependent helicase HrpB
MNVVLSLFLCYIAPKLRAFSPPPLTTSYSTRSSCNNCLLHSRILLDDVDTNHLQDLPINVILDSVKESIQTRPNLLLEASPGAGKTTIIPLLVSSYNTEDNDTKKKVIVVEPRRVATRSAAQRMSSLINQSVGESIGYAIRGESKQSSKTQVLVMTDGVLLNMLRNDPELNGVDVVILDEFHERGVDSDVALALLREVQMNYRPDLKIIIMSATLLGDVVDDDNETMDNSNDESAGTKLSRVLGGKEYCNVLRSEGRQYPITIQYFGGERTGPFLSVLRRDTKLLVKTMADAIEEGLTRAPNNGDILAFLPGAKEIRKVVDEIKSRAAFRDVDIFPLFGTLPKSDQDEAIYKGDSTRRRVIVSSPIAEASLTIDGVTCVIDSGLQRQPKYDINTGLPHLITVSCSKDSVIQRTGRAARQSEGYCIRLFTESEFNKLQQHAVPEIMSTDLVPTALLLSEWGCTNVNEILQDMPFVDPPPEGALKRAYNMLLDLGALEEYKMPNSRKRLYRVTSHGREVVKMATHPRFATAIIRAGDDKAKLVAAVIAAALSGDDLPVRRKETNLSVSIRNILKEGPSSFIGKQLVNFASRVNADARSAVLDALQSSHVNIDEVTTGTALLPGFIDLVAQNKGDASYGGSRYELSLGQSARLDDRWDAGDYILVIDTSTGDDGKTRIRSYVEIDSSTLRDVAVEKDEVYVVESKGYEVRARKVTKVGSLILSSLPLPSPPAEEMTELLLNTIEDIGGMPALLSMQSKKLLGEISELRQRIRLAQELTATEWPSCFTSIDAIENADGSTKDDDIMATLLEPWLAGAGSLKSLDILSILTTQLSAEQQQFLDNYFATKIESPDGSLIPITYSENGPVASAKLQQFFGCTESPTVGAPGKTIPVSLSLLSPAGKELAKTIDLPFFWEATYPSVRAEMRGRYPKHPWPDDPMTATASRLTKKQQQIQMPNSDSAGNPKVDKRKERSKKRKTKK